jgi:exopolysaccharide production protein ExoQ
MPPSVATVIYLLPVVWLFRRDFREKSTATSALWIPFFWVFISGTRFVSQWLEIIGLNLGGTSVDEGSPLDALFFLILILAGLRVLYRRNISLAQFIQENRWVTIYLLYCLVATSWSDLPLVSLKRWIKLMGQPVMALILLSEPDPLESLTRLLKRCAYIIIPVSILFIKYFPQWSTVYDNWTGGRMNTGITTDKNALGCDCFILGFFLVWHFLRVTRLDKSPRKRNELIICIMLLILNGWLLHMAHSSTSIGALILGVAVMFFIGLKFVNRWNLSAYLIGIAVVYGLLELLFNIHETMIHALGRNSTLTDRTIIWQIVLHLDNSPILGAGFESFWMGDRSQQVSQFMPGALITEAHNGYLETYLNLGIVGLFITLILLLASYFKAQRSLSNNFDFGRFRISYLMAFIIYNVTEAAFKTHTFPFFLFFLIAIDYQVPHHLKK